MTIRMEVLKKLIEEWQAYEHEFYTTTEMDIEKHVNIAFEVPKLLTEVERYRKGITLAMVNTHDDDTHEFLNRLLKGEESTGLQYRLNMELQEKDRVVIVDMHKNPIVEGTIMNINDFREPSQKYAVDVDGYSEDVLFFGEGQLMKKGD